MSFNLPSCDSFKYSVSKDGTAVIRQLTSKSFHFVVPSKVTGKDGSEYKIIGIGKHDRRSSEVPSIITFNESSEITEIPISFVNCCQKAFYLPPKIKSFKVDDTMATKGSRIICEKDNQFIAITSGKNIMNKHPFRVLYHYNWQARYFIRETARFIGNDSFYQNMRLISVFIPASVEIIEYEAFKDCKNLKFVEFKGKSRLKIIGISAFEFTSIQSLKIPENVEEIRSCAFMNCRNLSSVILQRDSKLTTIGSCAFQGSIIESIEFPATLIVIENGAFGSCKNLTSISFPADSELIKIGFDAFRETKIESIKFPSSLEMIDYYAFEKCSRLTSVSFEECSKDLRIEKFAFRGCPCADSIDRFMQT